MKEKENKNEINEIKRETTIIKYPNKKYLNEEKDKNDIICNFNIFTNKNLKIFMYLDVT